MRARVGWLLGLGILIAAGPASAASDEPSEARWVEVSRDAGVPRDVSEPEGRTRWDWSGITTGVGWTRRIERDENDAAFMRVEDTGLGIERARDRSVLLGDANGGLDVDRWILPQRVPGLIEPGPAVAFDLIERRGADEARLHVRLERIGSGWLHLPSGPRETVLQRALVLRAAPGSRDFRPERLVYRWVDPRAGLVAEVEAEAGADGGRGTLVAARYVESVTSGTGSLKIYSDQLNPPTFARVTYGFDRKGVCSVGGQDCAVDADCTSGGTCGMIPVSTLTPDQHTTIGALGAAPSWDFSGVNEAVSKGDVASTAAPINANETCSWDKCGFTRPGGKLGREDKWDDIESPTPSVVNITTSVTEFEDRSAASPPDHTIWIRAGIRNEGDTGSLGTGESRLCYVDSGRTEVPLWRFSNQDAGGWYMALGDTWSSDSDPATPGNQPFQCENNVFNHVCPNSCGLFCPIYTGACSNHTGTQYSEVIGEGPVTLPSGHTFNALVVKNVADFCAYLGGSCAIEVDQVRTVIYLWEVPWLGTVVRLMSQQNAPDDSTFSALEEVDIKYGPFPPRSITLGTVGTTSIDLSWDPGTTTRGIDRFKVYWDTDSGADSPYANSMEVPLGAGNSTTLVGLTAGTDYFITVTAVTDYANPATGEVHTYESLVLPMSASASPTPLPIEVMATTQGGSCVPTGEVRNLTATHLGGGTIQLCWDPYAPPVGDSCQATGYRVLGAASPESDLNFTALVADNGLSTCAVVNDPAVYYEVVALGTGGAGPR